MEEQEQQGKLQRIFSQVRRISGARRVVILVVVVVMGAMWTYPDLTAPAKTSPESSISFEDSAEIESFLSEFDTADATSHQTAGQNHIVGQNTPGESGHQRMTSQSAFHHPDERSPGTMPAGFDGPSPDMTQGDAATRPIRLTGTFYPTSRN